MTVRTLAVGNNNMNQVDHRSLIGALTASAGAVNQKEGLFPSNPLPAEISNVSAMIAGVGPFRAVVSNPSGPGVFIVQSDAVENISFDPGEASVTRTDRIIVRVYNDPQDASGRTEPVVEYLKGQPSGSATTVPSGALLLWDVPVPAGASVGTGGINFTSAAVDKRAYTVAAGGVNIFSSHSELASFPNPYRGMIAYVKSSDITYAYNGSVFQPLGPVVVSSYSNLSGVLNPYEGLLAYVKDVDIIYAYSGSSWQARGQIAASSLTNLQALSGIPTGAIGVTTADRNMFIWNGTDWVRQPILRYGRTTCSVSGTSSSTTAAYGITFPGTPRILVNVAQAPGGSVSFVAKGINPTATSFTIYLQSTTATSYSGSIDVEWLAVY